MRITGQFPPDYETRLHTAERMVACHYAAELRPLNPWRVMVRYRPGMATDWGLTWRLLQWQLHPVILLSQNAFERDDDYLGQCLMLGLLRARQGIGVWLFRWLELPDMKRMEHEVSKAMNAWRIIQRREETS